jgi:hypothetical protein
MQDYLNNRGKLQEPFEPFKSGDGSLKDARRHEWPWVFPADAYMTYHSVRLLMLGTGGFRLRCMLCKSWDVQTLLLLTAFGGRRGRICSLLDRGGGRLLDASRVME